MDYNENMIRIELPLRDEDISKLKCGDIVLLSGDVITARDMAHKRLYDMLLKGESLPLSMKDETVYYVGAAPAPKGFACGSAGPTSSRRMDPFTPLLMKNGLKATIGKGKRSPEVKKAIAKYHGIYFCTVGGAGALLSQSIIKTQLICFGDLGTEAVYRYTLKDFPCIVGIDSDGNDIFEK